MTCPDIDRIIDHATGTSPDPGVAAHFVVCGECLATFGMIRLIREAAIEFAAESEDGWELLDEQPREWMLWMMGDWLSFPEA